MQELCIVCKGRGFCGKPCKILLSIKKYRPKISKSFLGSTPPEIFVGRYSYPNVYVGILAPDEIGNTEKLAMPELWHKEKANIEEILSFRAKLVYSRFKANVKKARKNEKEIELLRNVSLSSKPVDVDFKLKRKPKLNFSLDKHLPLIGNPAPLEKAKIESNIKVKKKVEYIASDYDVKAEEAVFNLYKSKIEISSITKMLSAGTLGLKIQRKLVPTRWAVTTVDSIISKKLLEKIKTYKPINHFMVFNANYLGNYYEILLMPSVWSFEVIEISEKGYFGYGNIASWHDYEFSYGRKTYASSVTGAYYANRLAVCEYLEKIKRQASCLVLREIRKSYWAPCGVSILRECCREAFRKKPEVFSTLDEALEAIKKRLKIPLELFIKKSKLIKNWNEQQKLEKFV